MTTYLDSLSDKKFQGNVVIKLLGNYFTIRNPDSGLYTSSRFNGLISSVVINPTTIDIRKVNTTISSYSFRLLDKMRVITHLVRETGENLLSQPVEIWIGRSGVSMDFEDYFKLPITRIKKIDHSDNSYTFSTTEETDRMNRAIYDLSVVSNGSFLASATVVTAASDISEFPSSGLLRVGKELMSYSSVNLTLNRFLGVVRGEHGTTPLDQPASVKMVLAEVIEGNPIDIILKLLVSGGGGGSYDVLSDGLGISESLIDISGIESLRDTFFNGVTFTLPIFEVASALSFMEAQLLTPNNMRFSVSPDSRLTLALLDRVIFSDEVINDDTISSYPKWTVDENKIVNQVTINWEYNFGEKTYAKQTKYVNDSSVARYGKKHPLVFSFQGIFEANAGQVLVDEFADNLLARLSVPTPEISFNTHIDKSLLNIGSKALVESSQIPAQDGSLNFATELEVVSRSINYQTGDVQFKLAFASYSGINNCYLAPSDMILSWVDERTVTVAAGRGSYYTVGWPMVLYDTDLNEYSSESMNVIESIDGDNITFTEDFTVAYGIDEQFRLKFPDYDESSDDQKRYCFISSGSTNFSDNRVPYKITF